MKDGIRFRANGKIFKAVMKVEPGKLVSQPTARSWTGAKSGSTSHVFKKMVDAGYLKKPFNAKGVKMYKRTHKSNGKTVNATPSTYLARDSRPNLPTGKRLVKQQLMTKREELHKDILAINRAIEVIDTLD